MARETVDDLLAELDAALQASPSPDAIARVRERVREDATTAANSRWWLVAAASIVLVVAGAAVMMLTMRRETPASQAVVAEQAGPADAGSAAGSALPEAQGRREPSRTAAGPARPEVIRASAPAGLEVLVPPDEGEAIRALLRAIRDGRATVPPAQPIEDGDGRLLDAKPIDIPLIKIEPLPGIPALALGGKEK